MQAQAALTEDPDFTRRYRAVKSRDPRFDGQLFLAVSTTGIYCRPSCPARTPKPENVTFYTTSAAAHEAGYRACKRCLPDATPGSPEWNLRQDLAGRAMRLIREGVMNQGGVEALSTRLGYTSRHLHRILRAELGAGPLALARAQRAHTARALLSTTELSVSDVAFAAGFSSVRQFNATVREVFDCSPSQIRSRTQHLEVTAQQAPDTPLVLTLDLPVRQPFDAPGVFRFLAERAIDGVEAAELRARYLRFARTVHLPQGPGALEVTAQLVEGEWLPRLSCELSSLADVPSAVAAARRLLDLDADPLGIDSALSEDPVLQPRVSAVRGIRLPGTVEPQEYLVRAIVGQQISVSAARAHLCRLAGLLGTPYESRIAGLSRLFPSPAEILAGVPEPVSGQTPDPQRPLRLPARSVKTIRTACAALVEGQLDMHSGREPAVMREELKSMPGIGEWTAAYLSLRLLGDPDVWMTGDVALIAGAKKLGLIPDDLLKAAAHRELAETANRWSPWRSYAAMHLWAAASAPKEGPHP